MKVDKERLWRNGQQAGSGKPVSDLALQSAPECFGPDPSNTIRARGLVRRFIEAGHMSAPDPRGRHLS
jgi:hypothetical protein